MDILSAFMQRYMSIVSEVMTFMIFSGVFFIVFFTASFLLLKLYIRRQSRQLLPQLRVTASDKPAVAVGFFHPYCNAGGGGERVLWTAIRALQKRHDNVNCMVYTGDVTSTGAEILERAQQRFNIHLPRPIEFVFLHRRGWVEAAKYPYLTLLGQSLGSLLLGMEALMAFVPDVFVDSMGYSFTLPLFCLLGGCRVACYVHYPTISTDMLERVSQRTQAFNNAGYISRSPVLSQVKLLYYHLFAYLYGMAGKRSDAVMVNSTWTHNHIAALWQVASRTTIVYPPCDVTEFLKIPLERPPSLGACSKNIISVAQFRPEKDYPLQIRAFHRFLQNQEEKVRGDFCLLLVGSCRGVEDAERVERLRMLCKDLGVTDQVKFHLNVSFAKLKELLAQSTVGLHAMWNEHFGISVVECMAAGVVMLAHDSGGPKMDIVVPYEGQPTGFLAQDEESYAGCLEKIFSLSEEESLAIRLAARKSITRFSEEEFEAGFVGILEPLLDSCQSDSKRKEESAL